MNIKYIDRKTGKIIVEQPPNESFLRFLYQNPLGKLSQNALLKRKIVSSIVGRLMNGKSSRKRIAPFVAQYNINMNEAQKSVKEFSSFNDFFYRKLNAKARPIQAGIVSPGDGRLLAFENVSDVNQFYVKGSEFTLAQYLQNMEMAEQFKNASLFILRLAPNDYHRFHFPYAGIPTESKRIKGNYFSVSPYALRQNFTQVFCENQREYTLLKTVDKGEMLISPVGATLVGSIINTYKAKKSLQKGDEMGYFAFGGSTVVLLVDKNKVKIDADLLENTQNGLETAVKMGEKIGE